VAEAIVELLGALEGVDGSRAFGFRLASRACRSLADIFSQTVTGSCMGDLMTMEKMMKVKVVQRSSDFSPKILHLDMKA
jgi:hypothetical protein